MRAPASCSAEMGVGVAYSPATVISSVASTSTGSSVDSVTVSQVIAFLSFQVRVFVGLSLLRGDERAAPAAQVGPKDAPTPSSSAHPAASRRTARTPASPPPSPRTTTPADA